MKKKKKEEKEKKEKKEKRIKKSIKKIKLKNNLLKKAKTKSKEKKKNLKKKPAATKKIKTPENQAKKTILKKDTPVNKKAKAEKKPAAITHVSKPVSKNLTTKTISPATEVKTTPVAVIRTPKLDIKQMMSSTVNQDGFSIVFVCTGNMCRSPIAEGLMRQMINQEIAPDIRDKVYVQSCGIYALDGNKPSENAVKISAQHGVDITSIRSKPINRMIMDEADIIFAMSIEHLNFIEDNYPSVKSKTHLLKTYGEKRQPVISDSIPDPMGFTMEFYQKTIEEIQKTLDRIFPLIREAIYQKLGNR